MGRCLGQQSLREGRPALLLGAAANSLQKPRAALALPAQLGGLAQQLLTKHLLGARLRK